MSVFLLCGHPAAGHYNPLLSIGSHLRDNGHTVFFSSHLSNAVTSRIEREGFEFVLVRPAPSSLSLLLLPLLHGYAETFYAMMSLMSGLGHFARRYVQVIEKIRPDVVVSEMTYLGPLLAAEKKGIPHVLVHVAGLSLSGPGIPPFGSGLPIGTPPSDWPWWLPRADRFLTEHLDARISRARRRLGLVPGEKNFLNRMPAKWLNLTLTTEELEAPREPPPSTTYFVGPCFAGRRAANSIEFPFDRLSVTCPKIFVSLGTVFNSKPRVFRKIIEGFADGRYQLIVSAGRAFDRLKSRLLPKHILLFESVPQIELLERVDAVISHGGNNTVNETLAAGRPLLIMPVGGEQGDNASRVVYLGAGLRADIRRFDSREIRAKVERLIGETSFKQRTRAIAEELQRVDGVWTASRMIVRLAEVRQPLFRPPDYPLTVRVDTPMPWDWQDGDRLAASE